MTQTRVSFLCLLLVSGLLAACGCSSTNKGAASRPIEPTVELTGTSNAPVTGYYIAQGKRVELTGVLPMTNHVRGLSQLAVRRVNTDDTLILTARTRDDAASQTLRPKLDEGLRVVLDNLSLSSIPPQESLVPVSTDRIVLMPYWSEGAWVFDDPTRSLAREPFVKGMPEILDALVKDIPNARDGFRLTCSTKTFKGFQKKLVWVRAEGGGNYYRFEDKSLQGWLSPVMFRYFSETPKTLYLKAESKRS